MNLVAVAGIAALLVMLRSSRARAPSRVMIPGGRLGSPFGENRGDHIHQGVDVGAPEGAPIYAPMDGEIAGLWRNGTLAGAGNTVALRDERGTVAVIVMHLSRWAAGLSVGHHVRAGDVLGYVGRTDSSPDNGTFTSSGPHAHVEVMPLTRPSDATHWTGTRPPRVDPVPWLRARGVALV